MQLQAWTLAALLLLSLAGLASAGPYAYEGPSVERSPSELASAQAVIERSAGASELSAPLELELPRYRARALEVDPWRLEELAPEGLELRIPLHRALCFAVSADLSGGLPRLDAVDGDTYFCAGFELSLNRDWVLFAEDFQPASGVVGGGPVEEGEAAPAYSWDGHQLAIGTRWRVR
ncbi:MAG TPA: hypothetical protein DEA08_39375, partial [Planctomycetes bacterium]|nr:hypothetical protein [Planctomycetota bacterium]